ncbi:MAG TPA: hypothetical protein VL737_04405 [Candidatus Pristimantibacillus sp.]|nr:hypothetical protein [Candidatus Pristimantibacillus sp.]
MNNDSSLVKTLTKFKPPMNVQLGMSLFLLAGIFVAAIIPVISGGTGEVNGLPPTGIFLLTGLGMILLTAGLFAYLKSCGLGLQKTALVMSFGMASTVAVIKFVLAPMALYNASLGAGLQVNFLDPNTPVYYVGSGLAVLLLYVLVFRGMHRHYRKKYLQSTDSPIEKSHRSVKIALFVILGILLAVSGGWIAVVIGLYAIFGYVGYVFSGLGGPVLVAIAMAIFFAKKGFETTTGDAFYLKQPALLATFFWLGLTLIFMYHIMWVVFMVSLVQLWPFNTYTPK